MKRSLLDRAAWAVAGALAVALIGSLAGVVRGGPLDPPGAPSSTLPLVEPRTPIRQPAAAAGFPIVISAPGSYYLAENITGVTAQNGISIAADAVTLDLNGFVLKGIPGSLNGVAAQGNPRNASVHGGTVTGWGQNGIYGDYLTDSTYEDLRLYNNGGGGICALGNSLISHVVATNNGAHGILTQAITFTGIDGGIIRDSTASGNGLDGITVRGHALVVENLRSTTPVRRLASSTPATGSTPTTSCGDIGDLCREREQRHHPEQHPGRGLDREYRGGEHGRAAAACGDADRQPVGEHHVLEAAKATGIADRGGVLDVSRSTCEAGADTIGDTTRKCG